MKGNKKYLKKLLAIQVVLGIVVGILVLPITEGHANVNLADGSYTIDYTILRAENDSVSMANDYFEKPATVLVQNGQISLQLKLNHSAWITEFKVPNNGNFVDTDVISTDQATDTRVVQFKVDDLSKPLESKIHVIVESIDYDNHYTIRFAFDTDSIQAVQKTESDATAAVKQTGISSAESKSNNQQEVTANPRTGDREAIGLLFAMLLVSSFFLVRQFKLQS